MVTDEQLLDAFLGGDETAFTVLEARYRPRLTAFAARLGSDFAVVDKALAYLHEKAALLPRPNRIVQSILYNRVSRYARQSGTR